LSGMESMVSITKLVSMTDGFGGQFGITSNAGLSWNHMIVDRSTL